MRNKTIKEIVVPPSGKKQWYGGAYTIAFVYAKSGNVVIKGYYDEVKEYVKNSFTHYFAKYTLWGGINLLGKNCRTIISFWKNDIGIFEPNLRGKDKIRDKYKFVVRPYYSFEKEMTEAEMEARTLKFKRLPNKWIPEFEIY